MKTFAKYALIIVAGLLCTVQTALAKGVSISGMFVFTSTDYSNAEVSCSFTPLQDTTTLYELQLSEDGKTFKTISTEKNIYLLTRYNTSLGFNTEHKLSGNQTAYYRIKMIELNNVVSYSPIVKLSLKPQSKNIQLSSDVFTDHLDVSLTDIANDQVHIELFDASGEPVTYMRSISESEHGVSVFMFGNLHKKPSGDYVLRVTTASGRNFEQHVTKK